MVGRSPVVADAEQRRELLGLSQSRDRGEADRSRAILLTLRGWTSPEIADAFGVREDTVRLWRSAFMRGGVGTLRAGAEHLDHAIHEAVMKLNSERNRHPLPNHRIAA